MLVGVFGRSLALLDVRGLWWLLLGARGLTVACVQDETVKAHGFLDELSASLSVFRTRQIGTHSHSVSVCVPPSEALCLEGIVFQ